MLNISIVLYHPDWHGEVIPLVEELLRIKCLHRIYLVDNSEQKAREEIWQQWDEKKVQYIFTAKNVGYGLSLIHI